MSNYSDIKVGDIFGKWSVLGMQGRKALCECSCEDKTRKLVSAYDLLKGKSLSCGCVRKNRSLPKVEVGSVFGRWVVLEVDGEFSECECSCDSKTRRRVNTYTLQTGRSTCCGCIRKEENQAKIVVGAMYNNWKVLRLAGSKNGNNLVECECQCEKKTRRIIPITTLLQGKSKRCGCSLDIRTGDKFGRLTAVENLGVGDDSRCYVWKCVCDCGEIKEVISTYLRNGRVTSCGCLTKELQSATHTTHGLSHTREYHNEKDREWASRNPDKCAAKTALYRARKKRASPEWSVKQTNKAFEQLNKEKRRLKAKHKSAFEIDHIVPFTGKIRGTELNVVSGLHVWYNLQILPGSENGSKNSYDWPDAWDYTQADIDFFASALTTGE